MLNISVELDTDWKVSRVLDNILSLFKKNDEIKVDAELSGNLMETLQRLRERHHIMRDSIIKELQKSKA